MAKTVKRPAAAPAEKMADAAAKPAGKVANNKTGPTAASVDAFIDAVADERQRRDAREIRALMERLAAAPAVMWGPSIVGFGRYRYRYDSGREGEMCRIGFSPRKGQTVLYLIDGYAGKEHQLARLGRHRIGKSCLYIKRLSDIDLAVLEEMIGESLAWLAGKYPQS